MGNVFRGYFFEGKLKGNHFWSVFLRVRQRGVLSGGIFLRGSQGIIIFPDTFLEVR